MNNLGLLHEIGIGVPQDVAEARALWRQAAERGNPNGTFNIGRSLLANPADQAAGLRMLEEAAAVGNAPAQTVLRQLGRPAPGRRRSTTAWKCASSQPPPHPARPASAGPSPDRAQRRQVTAEDTA